jgi:translocation and assembly module TamB
MPFSFKLKRGERTQRKKALHFSMRRLRWILLGLLALIFIVLAAGWLLLQTQALWTWSGRRLVDFAQDRLYPKLTVQHVRGYPFTGITFENIALTTPQGEVITAKRLELRFSLWSFVKLEPVIGKVAVYEPRIHVWRTEDGSLNLSHLLRKRPPPPFRSLDFRDIQIEGLETTFKEDGRLKPYPRVDFRCALLVLHPRRPEQAIFVRRAMLSTDTPQGRFSLRTRLAYQRQELNLLTLEVYDEAELIALLGGKAQFAEAPFGLLSGEFKPLSGERIKDFLPWWPGAWNLAGKFSLEGSPADFKATAAGQLNGASYLLKGRLEQAAGWRYEVEMGLDPLKPDLAAALTPSLAAKLNGLSALSVRLQAKGTGLSWPPAAFQGRLTASPFTYRQAQCRELEVTLSWEEGKETLKGLVKGNFGQLALEAQGPLLARTQGTLKAVATDLQPHLLGLEAPAETLINGVFTGNVALPTDLALDRLTAAGELKASGRLGTHQLECQGRIAWEKLNLQISQAAIKAGDLTADLKGALKAEGLDIQAQVKLPPGGVLPWPTPLSGQFSATFAAKGPWRTPDLTLEGQGHNLAWRGYGVRSVGLKATAQGWLPSAGHLDLRAADLKTSSGTLPQVMIICQGHDHRWRFQVKAPGPAGPKAELLGAADLSRRPALLTVDTAVAKVGGVAVKNAAPVRVTLLPGLEIEPAAFQVSEGKVTLAARLRDNSVSGRLDIREVPAEVLPLPGLPLKGRLNGQVTVAGTPPAPVIQGRLQSGPGQVSEFSFTTLETSFAYQGALFTMTGVLAEKAGGPGLRWEGKLPLRLSLQPLGWTWGEDDFHFLVRGENTHLAMLTAFTQEVQEADGALDLLAEWRGTMSRPELTGHIRWGPGMLRFRLSGAEYRLQPGMVRLQGNTLAIPEVILESQGTARVSGEIGLEGFLPKRVEAKAVLHDFKILERSGSEAFTNGTVTLSGPWRGARLKGKLILTQGSFRTTFFQTGEHDDIVLVRAGKVMQGKKLATRRPKPAVYRDMIMDLQLAAPTGVWVKSKSLNIRVAGELQVDKATGDDDLYAKGLLQMKGGTLDVQGREFRVSRGEVHLPGTPGAAVTTTMRAVSKVSDLTLILDIRGPVNKPEVELSSEPPLPPADVLAYLVFSRPAQALTQQQFRTMGEQVVGVLGGFTAKKLKDLLGKDFPLVGDVYVEGSKESVGVAKPLTKDLTVTLERKTEPLSRDDTNQVRMDYRLNRHLKVESQLGRRNSGADVFFNVDF